MTDTNEPSRLVDGVDLNCVSLVDLLVSPKNIHDHDAHLVMIRAVCDTGLSATLGLFRRYRLSFTAETGTGGRYGQAGARSNGK